MTIPEIPKDAVDAGEAALAKIRQGVPVEHPEDQFLVIAVYWPHLYAAALRLAADAVEKDRPYERVRAQRVIGQSAARLRRMADEAEEKP